MNAGKLIDVSETTRPTNKVRPSPLRNAFLPSSENFAAYDNSGAETINVRNKIPLITDCLRTFVPDFLKSTSGPAKFRWIILLPMSTSLSSPAAARRFAGYFALVIALLSTIQWIPVPFEDYVMEHRWPAASGIVVSRRENSREVQPASSRQHRYWVYWAEFDVTLSLPPDRCPGETTVINAQPAQCVVKVASPHTRSRANAIQWLVHHPLDSTMTVHYEAATGRAFAGGESIIDLYPWREIGLTATLAIVAAAFLALGRKKPTVSDDTQTPAPLNSLSID